jgi:hypothetical protein
VFRRCSGAFRTHFIDVPMSGSRMRDFIDPELQKDVNPSGCRRGAGLRRAVLPLGERWPIRGDLCGAVSIGLRHACPY